MARGWESKSVEGQMDAAEEKRPAGRKLSDSEVQTLRQKENLLLSRTRIQNELETAKNPRYLEILRQSLRDLEEKLRALDAA
jgi:hypothetical protein